MSAGYAELHCSATSPSCAALRIRRSWSSAPRARLRGARDHRRVLRRRRRARAHRAARSEGHALKLIVGAEFRLDCGLQLRGARDGPAGLRRLCRLITRGRRAAPKGSTRSTRADLEALSRAAACILWLPGDGAARRRRRRWLARALPGRAWIASSSCARRRIARGSQRCSASGGRSACRSSRAATCTCMCARAAQLQDALTAIRLKCRSRSRLAACIRTASAICASRARLARLYPPELLAETLAIAARCTFSLDELRYEYPRELVPDGRNAGELSAQAHGGGRARRWPDGVPEHVREHDRARARAHRRPALRAVLPHRPRHRRATRATQESSARAAAPPPTRWCAIASASRRSIPAQQRRCCSSASSRASATSRRTSTSTSSTSGAKRSSSTSTASTAASARRLPPRSSRYRPRSALRDVGKALRTRCRLQVERLARTHAVVGRRARSMPERVREAGFDPGRSRHPAAARARRTSSSAFRGICRSTSAAS